MTDTYFKSNLEAIRKAEESYGPSIRWNNPACNPGDLINYLRLLGLKCSNCGELVTWGNLNFYKFGAEVLCYTCQKQIK